MTLATDAGTGPSIGASSRLRFSGRVTAFGLWVHGAVLGFVLAGIPLAYWLGFRDVRIGAMEVLVPVAMVVTAMACHAFVTGFHRLASLAEAMGLFVLLGLAFAVWQFFATASPFPFQDAQVKALDLALGFDWLSADLAFRRYPLLMRVLEIAYGLMLIEALLVLVGLTLLGHDRMVSKVFAVLILSYLATLLGHFLVPLIPPPAQIVDLQVNGLPDTGAVTFVDLIAGLRDGSRRSFDSARIPGLISLPSFHAVMAVLCTWAARPLRLLFPVLVPVNLCMLVSTIPCGGHYLLDVIAGVLLVVGVIAGVELAFRRAGCPRTA